MPQIAALFAAIAFAPGAVAGSDASLIGDRAGFAVAAGEQAVVMGYPGKGLEVWAYPLQLLSDYRVSFRVPGHVAPLDGQALLKRIEQHGAEVVRVYSGPDFVVREHLFTPLHEPGVMITYEVEGAPGLAIEVHFQPSLNLMWPGALGGQTVQWDAQQSAYVEREPLHGFSALIRSPEAMAHDGTANAATGRDDGLSLVLAPRTVLGTPERRASVIVTAEELGTGRERQLSLRLEAQYLPLREHLQTHHDEVLARSLRIVTPDADVNRALDAAETALDQAWVCAPGLGCGELGGYGPSRPGRRPQYAWFFAGDGLVAAEGFVAAGRFDRAREELAFVSRYQNASDGMIWHEISLSAPLIDWMRRYPYMFVHVDITYQYLATLADYERATGDKAFLLAHWTGIAAAYRYCSSLLDPTTGLPAIPPGKQGQNEQAQLRDDTRLSSAWIDAADGFARLARVVGKPKLAAEAQAAAVRARRSLAASGWDSARGFWLGGHTLSGAVVHDERSDASQLLQQGVFTQAQNDAALDRLASPDFQTDWGVRSLSRAATGYDPNAYSLGAVWALGTSGVASAFWAAHRPLTAWAAWRGLANWSLLDAPGHMHEVLAGDLYHPEVESVPAQTWSSAGLLSSAVHGLLGLQPDADAHSLTFAPQLPASWREVELSNVRVGAARLSLLLKQDASAVVLDAKNDGPPVAITFDPVIPLGAVITTAQVNGVPTEAKLERYAQSQHARLTTLAAHGETRMTIHYSGGVRLEPKIVMPQVGDVSRNLRIASADWQAGRLTLHAYVSDPQRAQIELVTDLKVVGVEGGEVAPFPGGYLLTLTPSSVIPFRNYIAALVRVTFSS